MRLRASMGYSDGSMIRYTAVAPLLLCLCGGEAGAQVVMGCGSLSNAYGPFDYRSREARALKLPIVEEYHLTPDVESLSRGVSLELPINDLDYVLRAFPNHPRALAAVAKWSLKGGKFSNPTIPSAECYFARALAFAPEDDSVRVIYGNYLFKRHRTQEAREQYETALRLSPQSPEINYDAGLLFVELGDIERAKALAKIAYEGGYPLPGLRNKIAAAEAHRQGSPPAPKHEPAPHAPLPPGGTPPGAAPSQQ